MFSKSAHLVKDPFDADIEMAATREGITTGLVEAGAADQRVVVLGADTAGSTRADKFAEKFPERFVQVGVAEQNMANIAVGLTLNGKIPFAITYAVFNPGRNWDQIRISGCYNEANVKYVSTHAGLLTGPDGATHQALEDIAITRCLPNMTVLVPSDATEAHKAMLEAAKVEGPMYIRLGREKTPVFTTEKTPFAIGKALVLRDGKDVAIIGAGPLMHEALKAADQLIEKGISCRVINSPSVKPLDERTIEKAAVECGAVVTVEDHQIAGGIGSAVAELLAVARPVLIEFVGMKDSFGESGKPEELYKKYKMDAAGIVAAVRRVVKRK